MLQTSLLLMKSLNKTESPIFLSVVFFVSKSNLFDVYFTLFIMTHILSRVIMRMKIPLYLSGLTSSLELYVEWQFHFIYLDTHLV